MHTHRHKPAHPAQTRPVPPSRTPAAVETNHRIPAVSADDIRLCAYRKWEHAGKPPGDGVQFWLEAEIELMRGA